MTRVAMVMVVGCGGIDAPPQDASVDVDATVDSATTEHGVLDGESPV